MNLTPHFKSLEGAYYNALHDLRSYGIKSIPRGKGTTELLAYNFSLENPLHRIVSNKVRKANPFYMIGNLLWVMSQSNELEFINYYNPRGWMFSDDGKILRGAYGKRIFDFDGINQFHQCIKELKTDPDSRRAIIHIHMPQHDWTGSLDTPCTADFQFFIRDNKLQLINHMRSQSAALVMPYDIFLMTMLMEYTAIQLGVEMGSYTHICNSLHYFEEEIELVDDILNNISFTESMERMPAETTPLVIKKLLGFEQELRKSAVLINNFTKSLETLPTAINDEYWIEKLEELALPKYWEEIGYLLIIKAMLYTNCPKDKIEPLLDKTNKSLKQLIILED